MTNTDKQERFTKRITRFGFEITDNLHPDDSIEVHSGRRQEELGREVLSLLNTPNTELVEAIKKELEGVTFHEGGACLVPPRHQTANASHLRLLDHCLSALQSPTGVSNDKVSIDREDAVWIAEILQKKGEDAVLFYHNARSLNTQKRRARKEEMQKVLGIKGKLQSAINKGKG